MSDARQRYDEANIRFSSGQLPPEDEGFYSRQMTRATMERIEEVAASVAALTERVEALTRTVAARDDVRQPAPPPEADAVDAFAATRSIEVWDCSGWHCCGCASTKVNTQIRTKDDIAYLCQSCVDELRKQLLARAAALPERSAPRARDDHEKTNQG
jgi:hypothetical protein